MNESEPARLEAIWIKRFRRGPMDSVVEATAIAGRGLEGNANQGGKRQVTVISKEAMERAGVELGKQFDLSARRANLLVSGVELAKSSGRVLQVGPLRLEIFGETRPCERMDEAVPGLRRALDPEWRGGVYGVVLNDAKVTIGDPVDWRAIEPTQNTPGAVDH